MSTVPLRIVRLVLGAACALAGCGPQQSGPDAGEHPLCEYYTEQILEPKALGGPIAFVEGAVAAGIGDALPGVDPKERTWDYGSRYGTGACILDFDGDGKLDLFLPLSAGDPPCGGPVKGRRLYRNLGGRRFADATEEAGLADGRPGMACAVGDIDSDGDPDLLVTDRYETRLYENARGVFKDITAASAPFNNGDARQTSPAFADIDSDRDLDLFIGEWGTDPETGWTSSHDHLFRNDGNAFVEITAAAGLGSAPRHLTLVEAFYDFDLDGDVDLYAGPGQDQVYGMSDASGGSYLWINQGGGVFRDAALEHGLCNCEPNQRAAAMMGLGVADVDNDGIQELAGSDTMAAPHTYLHCNAELHCERMDAEAIGIGSSLHYTKWAVGLFDFNDDGRIDLFGANGHTAPDDLRALTGPMPGEEKLDIHFNQRAQLFLGTGDGHRFEEHVPSAGDGLLVAASQRGAGFGDLDGDGDLDIVITSYGQRPLLFWNELSAASGTSWAQGNARAHPLNVRLVGTRSSAAAIGARVTVRAGDLTLRAQQISGGSYLSTSEPRLHFGLGNRGPIDEIRVEWPGGGETVVRDLPAATVSLTITEGQ